MLKTRNKYQVAPKAKRTLRGKTYASKKEKDYAQKLYWLMSASSPKERVLKFEEQVRYDLQVNEVHICQYVLDFKVWYEDGRIEHVDVKGYKKGSAYYIFTYKKRLMKAIHAIEIIEK